MNLDPMDPSYSKKGPKSLDFQARKDHDDKP